MHNSDKLKSILNKEIFVSTWNKFMQDAKHVYYKNFIITLYLLIS